MSLFTIVNTLPEATSTTASDVDRVYNFIMDLSIISFVLLGLIIIYFVFRYRRKSDKDQTPHITHNHLLETLWTVIPGIIFVAIGIWGWQVYKDVHTVPKDAMEIQVIGKQWLWEFTYPNGHKTINDLTVPIDQPVQLLMTSTDVLHSFYVPNFRIKKDLVPGMRTRLWFNANKEGSYRIYCAEFCGTNHSKMVGNVIVKSKEDYNAWMEKELAKAGEVKSPMERGKELYQTKACIGCHTLDGTRSAGPSFKALWGAERVFTDGTKVIADEAYIRESILNPRAKIVQGYPPVMPPFQGQLSEEDINALLEFIEAQK